MHAADHQPHCRKHQRSVRICPRRVFCHVYARGTLFTHAPSDGRLGCSSIWAHRKVSVQAFPQTWLPLAPGKLLGAHLRGHKTGVHFALEETSRWPSQLLSLLGLPWPHILAHVCCYLFPTGWPPCGCAGCRAVDVIHVLGRIVAHGFHVLAPRGQRLSKDLGTSSSIFNRAASLATPGFGGSSCALCRIRAADTYPSLDFTFYFPTTS